jgi:hypothetical protein
MIATWSCNREDMVFLSECIGDSSWGYNTVHYFMWNPGVQMALERAS